MTEIINDPVEALKVRAKTLKLYGLIEQWDDLTQTDFDWIARLVQWEEVQRNHRSLERRLSSAKLGRFKMLSDFDWDWFTQCDRGAIEDLMKLSFVKEASNVIFVGPNGVGKEKNRIKCQRNQLKIELHQAKQTIKKLETQNKTLQVNDKTDLVF